jgi:NAD(P)-dependent dehydrogenase (short-subunit alcohol dehydrogenase family)
MSHRLAGKIALVTGIGAGIGRECALVFAREGATVFGCDIDAARASATVAAAHSAGLAVESAHPVDLTKPADVQRYVDQAIERS